MSDQCAAWRTLLEWYARESAVQQGPVNPHDFEVGRTVLSGSPEARAWFVLEAWRFNVSAGTNGVPADINGRPLCSLATELLRFPLFCTPDQMQRIVWQSDEEDGTSGLLRNVLSHLEHWGMTPVLHKMLDTKRLELERIANSKSDRARLERINDLLECFQLN